jgi:hypothetical protein
MNKFMQRLALEDEAGQNKEMETEVIIYAKVGNFEGLHGADEIEEQYQLDGKFENGMRCRVRRTTVNEDNKYYFTFKVPTSNQEGMEANVEYTDEVSQEFFEGFKKVAASAVNKTRFVFHSKNVTLTAKVDGSDRTFVLPSIKYEVDVYRDSNGHYIEWCKIDVEIDNVLDYINKNLPEHKEVNLSVKINHLPFQPGDAIVTQAADEKQQAFIDSLWKTRYNQEV